MSHGALSPIRLAPAGLPFSFYESKMLVKEMQMHGSSSGVLFGVAKVFWLI
jgi:hypothetical protein